MRNTAATTATTANDPTAIFAQLAEARRAARAEEQAAADKAKADQEQERRDDAERRWHGHIYNRLSPALRDALDIRISTQQDPTERWYYVTTGHFTSPVTGSACTITVHSVYGDLFPWLETETGFTASLPERAFDPSPYQPGALDANLLDALDDEQAHIAEAEAKRGIPSGDTRAEAEQTAEQKAEEAAAKAVPFYELVEGRDTDGRGLLHVGSRVWLTVETPELDEHCKHETRCCDIVDWSDTWLLVKTRPGRQKLIPIARITEIQPASPTTQLG